jgi:hypothetical protein
MNAKNATRKRPTSQTQRYLQGRKLIRKNIDYSPATYKALEGHCERLYPGVSIAVKTLAEKILTDLCTHPQQDILIEAINNQKRIQYE